MGAPFFGWLRGLGITRRDDAWVAGVCSGIAARTGLDPLLVRGVAIVIAVLGGPVFLAYAVGWALLPDSRGHIHAESAVNGVFTYPMVFIGLAAALTFVPFMRGIWFDAVPGVWGMPDWLEATLRTLWVLALIAAGIWLTVAIARRVPRSGAHDVPGAQAPDAATPGTPDATTRDIPHADAPAPAAAPTPPPGTWWTHQGATQHGTSRERHEQAREAARARAAAWRAAHPQPRGAGAAFSSVVLGIALVAAALVGIGYGAVVPEGSLVLVISTAALVVVAVGIVIAGIRGRTSGGLGGIAALLAIVVVFTGIVPAGTQVQPFGTQRVDAVQALTGSPDGYLLVAGRTVVDADDLTARTGGGSIDVWLGAGKTEIVLPEGVPVRVESHVLAGTVTSSLGTERSGVLIDDDRLFTATGSPTGIPADPDAIGTADSAFDGLTAAQLARIPVIHIWLLAGTVELVGDTDADTER